LDSIANDDFQLDVTAASGTVIVVILIFIDAQSSEVDVGLILHSFLGHLCFGIFIRMAPTRSIGGKQL